ncbi:MAG: hypothetical protein OEN20_02060, partial [Gammaproteobacteria bacterium]|nr:hypothetical protein [Gammaproteobacteria bacterium]
MNQSFKISRRSFIKLGGSAATASGIIGGSTRLAAMENELGGKDFSAVSGAERKAVPYTCLACNIEDGGVAFV